MLKRTFSFTAVCFVLLFTNFAWSQDTEFWFGVPYESGMHGTNPCTRESFIMITTSDRPAKVFIYLYNKVIATTDIPANSFWKKDFTESSTTKIEDVENGISNGVGGTIQNKGIHIVSDVPVTAYYQANGFCSKDVFTMKGNGALGTQFIVPFQTRYGVEKNGKDNNGTARNDYDHFVIVATKDGTNITIKAPTGITGTDGSAIYQTGTNIPAGGQFNITLNRGQTYVVREADKREVSVQSSSIIDATSLKSLAGTEVTSNYPIAITMAQPGLCSKKLNWGQASIDLIGDQIVPMQNLGKEYLVIPGFGATNPPNADGGANEFVYIFATQDNTLVKATYNNGTSTSSGGSITINKGKYWRFEITSTMKGIYFDSDKPVYCFHQSANGYELGAALIPSMYSISSKRIAFYNQKTNVTGTKLFLMFRKGTKGDFKINNTNLTLGTAYDMPVATQWQFAYADVPLSMAEGQCVLSNTESAFAVGAFTYGSNYSTSYGFMSGFGSFKFDVDTLYKCQDGTTLLDGGYGASYKWTKPDGTVVGPSSTQSTLSVLDTGWYKVEVDQGVGTPWPKDSIYVADRFGDIRIVSPPGFTIGEDLPFSVDFGGEYSANVNYTWITNGLLTIPDVNDKSNVLIKWTDDETKIIRVKVTDYILGCDTILEKKEVKLPDNVDTANCVIKPTGFDWGIKSDYQSPAANHHNYAIPLVGFIDDDDMPDVVTVNTSTNYLNILWGKDKSITTLKMTAAVNLIISSGGAVSPYAMCRTKIKGIEKTIIIVCCNNGADLYAYDLNGPSDQTNQHLWKVSGGTFRESIGIADFDNDGIPEFYISNKIYDASTGILLVSGTGNSGYSSGANFTIAADVIGDEKLELIAGTEIYSVKINNKSSALGNSLSRVAKLNENLKFTNGGTVINDGQTVVADINQDGRLDVIFTCSSNPASISGYRKVIAWDVATESLLCMSDEIYTSKGTGIPFVGNIDEDPDLEVVFMIANKLLGYKPDFATRKFNLAYSTNVDDESGCTGMTLFDFNQDGQGEIVYRDQTLLRIMKSVPGTGGNPGTFSNLKSYNCTSTTSYEYPVVADVDNDGAAEIVVIGNTSGYVANGYLWIYKSGTSQSWAPARSVWNQYAYNVVNINEDLTVPKYQFNPTTLFPGMDGEYGTSDDIRPFNNFLQQQTKLNKFGTPLFLAANPGITNKPIFNYDVAKDSMIIQLTVHNIGAAALQDPVKITVYKNTEVNSPKQYTYAYPGKIPAGDTAVITFGISNFKTGWIKTSPTFEGICIRINDNGNGYAEQPVCDSNNRNYNSKALIASDDHVLVFENSKGNEFKVTLNDLHPIGCNPLKVNQLLSGPMAGANASLIKDTVISYIPKTDFIGRDTIRYEILCGSDRDTATVYIHVIPKPDNISDADCFGEVKSKKWGIKESWISPASVKVEQHRPWLAGDLDGDKIPEIVAYSPLHKGSDDVFSDLVIFPGNDRDHPIIMPTVQFGGYYMIVAMGLVRIENKGLIIILGYDGYLYAYDYATKAIDWVSDTKAYSGLRELTSPTIGFADFDGDGIPEIYLGNMVFDAGGHFICKPSSSTANRGFSMQNNDSYGASLSFAADFDSDGLPELVVGNEIYTINIPAKKATLYKSITPPALLDGKQGIKDGHVSVADINKDGSLDVVVSLIQPSTSGRYYDDLLIYIWDVKNDAILYRYSETNKSSKSIPFIGDIDNDGELEIIIMSQANAGGAGTLTAFKRPASGDILTKFWEIIVNENWGRTGITLFDFDQDNSPELVYRDQALLRIIDGSTSSPYNKASYKSTSGTTWEYPIVLDVDNDGMAEIVCAGDGRMSIYKPDVDNGAGLWAPARRVWNQYAYNVVNVNDNLTIPKHMVSSATVFPGKDGQLGTVDDVRPFNNFLQQATILNKNGTPLWLTAFPGIAYDPHFTYDPVKDSLTIHVPVYNIGEAALHDSVKITVYRNEVGNSKKYTYGYPYRINVGDTALITFGISKFKQDWVSISPVFKGLKIRINDKGNGYADQPVCDSSDRDYFSHEVILSDDRIPVFACGETTYDILRNNIIPSGAVFGTMKTYKGTASIENGKINYSADIQNCCDWAGNVDTMVYSVCNSLKDYCDTASLLIDWLFCPEIRLEDSCSVNPKLQVSHQYMSATYDWEYYNGTTWVSFETGTTLTAVPVKQEGKYRLTMHYKGLTHKVFKGIELIENKKISISGGLIWYEMTTLPIPNVWD